MREDTARVVVDSPLKAVAAGEFGRVPELTLEEDWSKRGSCVFQNMAGRNRMAWVKKAHEASRYMDVILMSTSGTDTEWFHYAWRTAAAVCFWKGRIRLQDTGTSNLPTVLFYWGNNPVGFCDGFAPVGITAALGPMRVLAGRQKPRLDA